MTLGVKGLKILYIELQEVIDIRKMHQSYRIGYM